MHLRKMTRIVIVGIIISFSIRICGTVFPEIFKDMHVTRAAVLIHTLFILSHLLFWLMFYKEYASSKKPVLKNVGSSIFLCFHLIVLFKSLEMIKLEWLEQMTGIVAVGTLPLIILAAFLILTFYYRFYHFLDSVYALRSGNKGSS